MGILYETKFKLSMVKFIIISVFAVLLFQSKAESSVRDTTFKILLEGGAGYGLSTDTLTQAGSRYGLSAFVRVLWKPDHLLKCGFETGWMHIASNKKQMLTNEFGTSEMNATLKAVPVMLVFDIDLWKFNLYTGLGYYYVISSASAFGESVSDSRWNVGFSLSLAYRYPVMKNTNLCGELKWSSIGELGKTLLSAQLFLSYNLFEW